MGKSDKVKDTFRQISKKITDSKLPTQHIGSHSFETLWQEIFSLGNTKPMFRDLKWFKKSRDIRDNILNGISHGKTKYQTLIHFLNSVEVTR